MVKSQRVPGSWLPFEGSPTFNRLNRTRGKLEENAYGDG